MIVFGAPGVSGWAAAQLGIAWREPCVSIGQMLDGKLVAAAVFTRYSHPSIDITFVTADRRWATPEYVRAVFRYPFVQLGCKRITALTEATNQRARAFLCRLGFREEGYHQDAFDAGDGVSYGLLRKDAARWLAEEPRGQVGIATSST